MPACTVQIEQIMCPLKVFGFKNTEKNTNALPL